MCGGGGGGIADIVTEAVKNLATGGLSGIAEGINQSVQTGSPSAVLSQGLDLGPAAVSNTAATQIGGPEAGAAVNAAGGLAGSAASAGLSAGSPVLGPEGIPILTDASGAAAIPVGETGAAIGPGITAGQIAGGYGLDPTFYTHVTQGSGQILAPQGSVPPSPEGGVPLTLPVDSSGASSAGGASGAGTGAGKILSGLLLANALKGLLSPDVLARAGGGGTTFIQGPGGGSPVQPTSGIGGASSAQLAALLASASQNAPHRGLAPRFEQRMGGLPEDPGLAADFTALNSIGLGR